jgi:hypothetical protein
MLKIIVKDKKTKEALKKVLRHLHDFDMKTYAEMKYGRKKPRGWIPCLDEGLSKKQQDILGLLQHMYLDEADGLIEIDSKVAFEQA